jgi:hypothetical protein
VVEEYTDIVALTCLGPSDGREVEEAMVWPAREQAEDVAQVRPWFDAAESTAGEQRGEEGVDRAPLVAADEEPIFATDGKSRLILPMSHFARRSTIAGIPRTAARSMFTIAKSAAVRRSSSALSRAPRRRSSSPRGCSTGRSAYV